MYEMVTANFYYNADSRQHMLILAFCLMRTVYLKFLRPTTLSTAYVLYVLLCKLYNTVGLIGSWINCQISDTATSTKLMNMSSVELGELAAAS